MTCYDVVLWMTYYTMTFFMTYTILLITCYYSHITPTFYQSQSLHDSADHAFIVMLEADRLSNNTCALSSQQAAVVSSGYATPVGNGSPATRGRPAPSTQGFNVTGEDETLRRVWWDSSTGCYFWPGMLKWLLGGRCFVFFLSREQKLKRDKQ